MNLNEQNSDLAGDAGVGRERQSPREEIGDDSLRVGEESISHDSEDEIHGKGLTGPDLVSRNGGLAHHLALVVQVGGAVGELEPHTVGILDGDVGVEGEVEVDFHAEWVEGEVHVLNRHRFYGGDGAASLENCCSQNGEEEGDSDEDGQGNKATPLVTAALLIVMVLHNIIRIRISGGRGGRGGACRLFLHTKIGRT